MDESAEPTHPDPEKPTPEVAQLLKLLEIQTAVQRERRIAGGHRFQGVSFRYGSLVAIVVFALGSVGVMEWFLSQLPRPAHAAAQISRPGPAAGAQGGSSSLSTSGSR